MPLSRLFHGIDQFGGGFPFLGQVHVIGMRKEKSLGIAEGDALGLSIAEIAFHSDAFLKIKGGVTERAGDDTGFTSDAKILVDDHPVIKIGLPVACLCRADLDTIGFFTVIADHGKVDACVFPLDHFDPRSARIT